MSTLPSISIEIQLEELTDSQFHQPIIKKEMIKNFSERSKRFSGYIYIFFFGDKNARDAKIEGWIPDILRHIFLLFSFKLCYIFLNVLTCYLITTFFKLHQFALGKKEGGGKKIYQIFKHESEFKKLSDINLKFTSVASNSIWSDVNSRQWMQMC